MYPPLSATQILRRIFFHMESKMYTHSRRRSLCSEREIRRQPSTVLELTFFFVSTELSSLPLPLLPASALPSSSFRLPFLLLLLSSLRCLLGRV